MTIFKNYIYNKFIVNGNAYLFMKFTKTKLSFKHSFLYWFYCPVLFLYNLPNNLAYLLFGNKKDKVTGDFIVDNLRKDYK